MNCDQHKEKRLREGGVGPEMRSPAGLTLAIMGAAAVHVKACCRSEERGPR